MAARCRTRRLLAVSPSVATYTRRRSGSNAWQSGAACGTPFGSTDPMRHTRARARRVFSLAESRLCIAHRRAFARPAAPASARGDAVDHLREVDVGLRDALRDVG